MTLNYIFTDQVTYLKKKKAENKKICIQNCKHKGNI